MSAKRKIKAAFNDLTSFMDANKGALASIAVDLFGPLADILDVISGVVGKDINGWISGGFQKMKGLGTWARIKMAAGGAIRALGGAVNVVGKIRRALKKAKKFVADFNARAAAAAAAAKKKRSAPACNPACFVAGTAVWLLTGAAIPIEELRPGDMVETSTEHSAAYGLAVVPGSPEPIHRLLDEDCQWVTIEGVLETEGRGTVQVQLLRPYEWLAQQLVDLEGGGQGIWIEFPDVSIAGLLSNPRATWFERPEDWAQIGKGSAMPLLSVLVSGTDNVGTLTVDGEEIGVTADHWFRSASRRTWVFAEDLEEGEVLESGSARTPRVTSVFRPWAEPEAVWTLEVAGARTFLVADGGCVVHNSCSASNGGGRAKDAATPIGRLGQEMNVPRGTNAPTTIDGQRFTGHAVDQMQSRGIMPSVVNDTIRNGVESAGRDGARILKTDQLKVIMNPSGSVKTVYPQ